MAIIKCPNCGKEISDQGGACPNCLTSVDEIRAWKEQQKPQKKKKGCGGCLITFLAAIGALVVLSVIGLFVLSGEETSSTASGSKTSPEPYNPPKASSGKPSSNAYASTPAPAPDPEPASISDSGNLGDYYVEIKEAYTTTDYEGKPAFIVTYSWTNNSDKTTSAMVALYAKAFQDGIQLDTAIIMNSDVFDSGSTMTEIRPGTTLDVQSAFILRNSSSDVDVEISELISFSDDIVGATFELS